MRSNGPIVVGVDGSAGSAAAVAWGAQAAAQHRAPLHLVHALDPVADYGPGITEPLTSTDYARLEGHGRWVLDTAAEEARIAVRALRDVEVSTELVHEPAGPALLDRTGRARLTVVGTRERGTVRRALLGSVSAALARRAHCPVVVVREGAPLTEEARKRPVVVGVDGTEISEPAIEAALREASARGVPLLALHVWIGIEMPTVSAELAVDTEKQIVLAESLAGWQERFPEVLIRREIVTDRPERSLLERSEQAQLLVVGSRGRGGFAGMLFGSTSQALLLSVACPIMIVRDVTMAVRYLPD
ncbi:universal stress protein [Streptomyces gardneri]|uniref:universal stress protein n=1 Tax=Nocardia sputi TaxID=2943705 RepID=UPI0018959777|nr:universal stress protein [Nocardia sputi]MBF6163374.1 universal stress protein [Streptomyces gardneri]UAK35218.1 universal stress protein [Nocardia asteroides]